MTGPAKLTQLEKITDRFLGGFGYLFPILDLFHFFKFGILDKGLPLTKLLWPHIGWLFDWYDPMYSLFSFAFIYIFYCRPTKIRFKFRRWVRWNAVQSLLIGMLCQVHITGFLSLESGLRQSLFGVWFEGTSYLLLLSMSLYCLYGIIVGVYPYLPVISDAADIHIPNRPPYTHWG
uniref:Conserved protein n=1 Tax=Haptophyceae sp. NIES-3900 TaxID=2748608 RepID=A0A7R6WDW4_9EUKA|nr:conserved protein [Haptophyceae sp. NIES-3900]